MRLIDADEALRISKEDRFMWVYDLTDLEKFLTGVPTIEAEPVKHGRWIAFGQGEYCCSECNTSGSPIWKRCPICEAKMDLEGD